jgi:BolA protein
MSVASEIRARLVAAFAPEHIEVVDESESHRGHAGHREGGESHFHVTIRAPVFGPMGRIERHRAIHAALGKDLTGSIHALGLTVSG